MLSDESVCLDIFQTANTQDGGASDIASPSNSSHVAEVPKSSPPSHRPSPQLDCHTLGGGGCAALEVTLSKDEIMLLAMSYELQHFTRGCFNFSCLLSAEQERLLNLVEVFECFTHYWLPKLKATFSCHDVLSCVSNSQECIVRFIAQVFMPSSLAFRQLIVNYQCSDNLGKVIFPLINVLLVLPCIDSFFQRILLQDNVVSLDSSFLYVLKQLKQMQLNDMEYAVLLQYLPLRALSSASNVHKEQTASSPLPPMFFPSPIQTMSGTNPGLRDAWGRSAAAFYPASHKHSSPVSIKHIISSETLYINNILVTLFGAAGKLKMLEKVEDILQNFQFASAF